MLEEQQQKIMKVNGNVYYSPENDGLEIFYSIDTAGSYEFDIFLIVKKVSDGSLYYATDSGCSCPTPFEDTWDVSELTEDTLFNFEQALENHSNMELQEILSVKRMVKDHLKNRMKDVVNDVGEFFS